VNSRFYFSYFTGTDPLTYWIQFQAGNYQIRPVNVYIPQIKSLGDRYAVLLTAFNTTLLYLSFVKIMHALAMREFGGSDFVLNDALRDQGDI
jgi:hypothetical protein